MGSSKPLTLYRRYWANELTSDPGKSQSFEKSVLFSVGIVNNVRTLNSGSVSGKGEMNWLTV